MAVINSVGVGTGSKSVGEFTYRSVRGRTIASKRVLKNSSNSAAQGNQRSLFAALSKFLTAYDCYVFNAFSKTRYGSRRNHAASELKTLSPYIRSVYEELTASGVPKNILYYWFAQVMSAIDVESRENNSIGEVLLVSSNSGVSLADVTAQPYTTENNQRLGFLFQFAIDKCGVELLEIIRSRKPGWAALSDSEVLRRAFTVSSYGITNSGRGVSLGERMSLVAPSADTITPIGSFVTPSFNLLPSIPLNADELVAWGLDEVAAVSERVYTFNILKFLGEPVNVTFNVAFAPLSSQDVGMFPIEL